MTNSLSGRKLQQSVKCRNGHADATVKFKNGDEESSSDVKYRNGDFPEQRKASVQSIIIQAMVFAVLTVLLFLTAVILGWVIIPIFIKYQISNKAVISPEANPELYSAWIHPPVPVFLKVYLFNVTNPEAIRKGAFPKLQEVGPYVFLENRTKVNITHDESSDTVTYKEYISFHFQPNLSGSVTLQDVVTIINVPFVAAAMKSAHDFPWPASDWALSLISAMKEPVFIKKTVEETLFKGWKVPFLEKIENNLGFSMIPNNTFGFFIGQNDTTHGPVTVSRGTHNKSMFGAIVKFKNESELSFWGDKNSFCNKLQGTDGTIFPPFVNKSSTLWLFNPELCRSLYVTYREDTVYEGIKGLRFTAPESVIRDPRKSEENKCFCNTVESKPEKCLSQGALDLSPCRDGPVAISNPFFLFAVPEYIEESGLMPDRVKHETFLNIEPLTGIILQASKKVQINLILKPVEELSSLKNVLDMLFPLVWADECASLEGETLEKLKWALWIVDAVNILSKWGLIPVALILSFLYISRLLKKHDTLANSIPENFQEKYKKIDSGNANGEITKTTKCQNHHSIFIDGNEKNNGKENKLLMLKSNIAVTEQLSKHRKKIPFAVPEEDSDS